MEKLVLCYQVCQKPIPNSPLQKLKFCSTLLIVMLVPDLCNRFGHLLFLESVIVLELLESPKHQLSLNFFLT